MPGGGSVFLSWLLVAVPSSSFILAPGGGSQLKSLFPGGGSIAPKGNGSVKPWKPPGAGNHFVK